MHALSDLAAAFEANGFVTLDDFIAEPDIRALRTRAAEIVAAFEPAGASVFTTHKDAPARDAYFLESATTVRCFFEEGAFDERGDLLVRKDLAINKIGHALHDLDPVFARVSADPRLDELVRSFGMADPRVYQSMYIFKQPKIGGVVDWHQDGSFFATDPESVITLWFALEDATVTNGCLSVEPGGHRSPLRERFVTDGAGGTRFERLADTPWPGASDAVPVEVRAGALVVMHGRLPHYSAPNTSVRSRHAYTLHVVDGAACYDARNWLQRAPDAPAPGLGARKISRPREERSARA
jgi:phytanoyl-CoA hydroxylase